MKKVIRTTTVPISLDTLLEGQLHFLSNYYEVIAVSGKEPLLTKVANREKVTTRAVTMQRKIAPIQDLISLIKLVILFTKEKPLIIHSMTPKAGLLSMIAGCIARVPIRIHTFTGLVFPSKKGFLKKLLIAMDTILCRCATHIYPEGEGVKKDLVAYKITNKSLKIIAKGSVNGINCHYFNRESLNISTLDNLRASLHIQQSDVVVVFIGRLVTDKGINELVAAFTQLQQQTNTSYKLLLVGTYEQQLDPLLPETLEEINTNPAIIEVGWQDDVRPYLAISHSLVFPSYREGFPNVVLQAGAMELPCIVSNINGCNEIIEHGTNGLIVPPKDTNALVEAMLQLSTDSALYHRLQSNSRKMIETRYSQQQVWEALLNEYQQLEQQWEETHTNTAV